MIRGFRFPATAWADNSTFRWTAASRKRKSISDQLPVPAASNTLERIKRVNPAGTEFWSARELARVSGGKQKGRQVGAGLCRRQRQTRRRSYVGGQSDAGSLPSIIFTFVWAKYSFVSALIIWSRWS